MPCGNGRSVRSDGYTLVEVMVAIAVSGLMAVFVMGVVMRVARLVTLGTQQIVAGHDSRTLQVEMTRRINRASVSSGVSEDGYALLIRTYGSNTMDCAVSSYTVNTNNHTLVYDPDVARANDEEVVAYKVHVGPSTPFFRTVRVNGIVGAFGVHGFLGDRPLDPGANAARRPFHGVAVDFLVSPRDTR